MEMVSSDDEETWKSSSDEGDSKHECQLAGVIDLEMHRPGNASSSDEGYMDQAQEMHRLGNAHRKFDMYELISVS